MGIDDILAQKGIVLSANQVAEDLEVGDLFIVQSKSGYRFTSDSVLLANSVKNIASKHVVELCSGSGVISILLAYKQRPSSVVAVEFQQSLYNNCLLSLKINNQQDIIKPLCLDCNDILSAITNKRQSLSVKQSNLTAKPNSVEDINLDGKISLIANDYLNYFQDVDCVVANPPYRKLNSGQTQQNQEILLARHEVGLTLQQLLALSSAILKDSGSFYLIHQVQRLSEIMVLASHYNLQPKELTFICARQGVSPKTVIIKATKCGKVGLTILPDIIIFDKDGNYTQTVKQLYGKV
ncbi:MAG: hypothetical protein RR248_00220 [Clostridia bacterium]